MMTLNAIVKPSKYNQTVECSRFWDSVLIHMKIYILQCDLGDYQSSNSTPLNEVDSFNDFGHFFTHILSG